ncbi:uncharacterized protein LOC107361469 [Tetranychus urticae]|uniref:uncharacterized protein LOC107361469 n=1 Tax=Tetranychus urticae TaxID=32264 RepID=UPI00077BD6E1|nr:uncharacterized protein LOC107361469 [Tetranychus urticae]
MADSNESSGQTPKVSKFDDQLTIINRSKTYHVSKKFMCSSIPYFEKMFCCDLLETRESKVELDFDEYSFDCVLNWIHSDSVQIKMESVIHLANVADYLMLNDDLSKDCYSYFHANFTIKHLPVVIPQVTKTSKLINSGALNTFICRHFLKIIKTSIFLDYPVETVEYICRLDLIISSEYQVLEAIIDWINVEAVSRKKHHPRLLRCIRWCYAGTDVSSKLEKFSLIATVQDIDKILCSPDNCKLRCALNRTEQCFIMSIQKIDDTRLSLKLLQLEQFWLPIGYFTLDDSLSLEFVHGENISDVLFDCGTKGVRIDWDVKKFRWLNFKSEGSYYRQINKLITISQISKSSICYLQDDSDVFSDDPFPKIFNGFGVNVGTNIPFTFSAPSAVPNNPTIINDNLNNQPQMESPKSSTRVLVSLESAEMSLLESDGKFIVIGKTKDKKFFSLFPVRHPEWFKAEYYGNYDQRSFIATVLGSNIFILTQKLKFIQFNYETKSFKKTKPFKDGALKFGNLTLNSRQQNDDIIVLIDKSSGKIHIFNIVSQSWIETGQIKNRKLNTTSQQDCTSNLNNGLLMSLTTVFLPLDKIKPCFKRKRSLLIEQL